jgi:hypothetical protein
MVVLLPWTMRSGRCWHKLQEQQTEQEQQQQGSRQRRRRCRHLARVLMQHQSCLMR